MSDFKDVLGTSCLLLPHINVLSLLQDIDSLSTIAGQLLGLTPEAVNLTTAAVTPAPE